MEPNTLISSVAGLSFVSLLTCFIFLSFIQQGTSRMPKRELMIWGRGLVNLTRRRSTNSGRKTSFDTFTVHVEAAFARVATVCLRSSLLSHAFILDNKERPLKIVVQNRTDGTVAIKTEFWLRHKMSGHIVKNVIIGSAINRLKDRGIGLKNNGYAKKHFLLAERSVIYLPPANTEKGTKRENTY